MLDHRDRGTRPRYICPVPSPDFYGWFYYRRIHVSGVQRKWLLSSDHWELLNVFSLPEIKCWSLEWMTVFSSHYPSTTCKVCVDILVCMTACVNHNSPESCPITVAQEDHSCTLSWHMCHFVMFLFCCRYRWSSNRVGTVRVSCKEYWSEEGASHDSLWWNITTLCWSTVTLHPPPFPIHYILWYRVLNVLEFIMNQWSES